MRVDLVAGVTPVSLVSVERTSHELTELIDKSRTGDAGCEPTPQRSVWELAEIAHRSKAGLLAVVEHPGADPAIVLAVLVATSRPLDHEDAADLHEYAGEGTGSEFREVIRSRSPRGYPVVIVERTFDPARLGTTAPVECQLQAVVADVKRPRVAVFTLSSPTGRGWLDLSGMFGHLIASVDFTD